MRTRVLHAVLFRVQPANGVVRRDPGRQLLLSIAEPGIWLGRVLSGYDLADNPELPLSIAS